MDEDKKQKIINDLRLSSQLHWNKCAITDDPLTLFRVYCKGFSQICGIYGVNISELCDILDEYTKNKYKI